MWFILHRAEFLTFLLIDIVDVLSGGLTYGRALSVGALSC